MWAGNHERSQPARLIAPQVFHHSDAPDQRSVEIEFTDTLNFNHGINRKWEVMWFPTVVMLGWLL